MKSSIPFSQILQLQCDLARLQLQCADLKEYDAGWLKDGKKVTRQDGRFAKKEGASEADKQLVEKSTPFVKLPDSAANNPRLIKKLHHLREIQSKISGDFAQRDDLESKVYQLKNLQSTLDKFKNSKKDDGHLIELSLRDAIAKVEKNLAEHKNQEKLVRLSTATEMTISAIGEVLGVTAKLALGTMIAPFSIAYNAGKLSGKTGKAIYNAGVATGEAVGSIYKSTEPVRKGVSESAKKAEERNQQNKIEVAKRYEKKWQQEKKDWSADKAMKAAEDLGSDVANHVMKSLAPKSAIAAAKSDTLTNFADALEMLQDPNIDFDFLFYLLSKPDFRAAILQQVVN